MEDAHRLIRADVTQLTGEKNLIQWDSSLWGYLNIYDLQNYILQVIDEPTSAVEKKEWRVNRAVISAMISNSLSPAVYERLIARGWDPREQNPKVIYDLIKKVLPRVTQEAVMDCVIEYSIIDRTTFGKMQDFLTRLRYLYKKIEELKAGVTEAYHTNLLVAKLKKTYPDRFLFWVNGLKEKTLTWEKLNQELEEIAASEEAAPKFSKVNKEAEAKVKELKDTKGRRARKLCDKCSSQIMETWEYKSCGHHAPKDKSDCWWCDPSKAPNSWPKKKEAEELKKKQGATTAVVVHNGSGLANPLTQTSSSLLFAPNFFIPRIDPKEAQ
ncbi:hypothetical protein B0T24DRAFT_540710 [Lasiosphaeria ovina]|uniref:Uncharacterized protein n=1 Tax=Lasiosphaeria ovina TaxID=92902 RepID=A0AAE0MXV2_9PEZI|nr:hypothetical protein B0T24DRAFT_540710 [Lasiosphaeria ovina]